MTLHEIRKRTAEKMEPPRDEGSCRVCCAVVKVKTLSDHGGMCFRCFSAYCHEPFVKREPSAYAKKVQALNAGYRKGTA